MLFALLKKMSEKKCFQKFEDCTLYPQLKFLLLSLSTTKFVYSKYSMSLYFLSTPRECHIIFVMVPSSASVEFNKTHASRLLCLEVVLYSKSALL